MKMGCGSSKKLLPVSSTDRVVNPTFLPEGNSSREPRQNSKTNVKGKSNEKKGKVRFRFDPIITEQFEIKAQIGRGSFSRVVRVENKKTRQPYAIKMMELKDIAEGKDMFESEITALRKVNHRYIVHLYDLFVCKDRVYLVMELATGGELFDRIVCKGHFTERDAARVMYMVLDGVRYLHDHGITHRDLKLENLLYYHPGNDSRIMITDFGLSHSKKTADDSVMATTCGTPEYIAPEILSRKPYTNAVDMWAIGVITFILLSGRMPFFDEHRPKLYAAILAAKYSYTGEPWNDVSDLAKDFVDKLIVVEMENRMTADEALHHSWIYSMAASSSLKNLHGSISQNWFKQSTSRISSAQSDRPRSHHSGKSNRTWKSLASGSKHNKPNESLFSEQRQVQSKVKTKRVDTLPAMAEGVAQRQSNGTKPSKLRGKLTARQVVEELYTVISDQAEAKKSIARMEHPNGTGPTTSSLDGIYTAGFGGKLGITEPNAFNTSDKNKNIIRSSDLEKQATLCEHVNKRSTKVPISETRPVLRDNFLFSDTPHNTDDNGSCKIQQNTCSSEACNYMSEPQSMSISRGNKISSA